VAQNSKFKSMSLSAARSQSSKLSPEPWLAVNLSMFFPGIGQLYAGERLRGLGFICSQVVVIAIASWSIFSPSGNTVTGLSFLFLSAIIYIFNLFDAYAYANKHRTYATVTCDRFAREQRSGALTAALVKSVRV
jgi:signal peptidase I